MVEQQKGVIDALSRILRAVLEKPVAKNALRSMLSNIDPQSAPGLVREIMWRDPELVFSFLAALPQIANCGILAVKELTEQVEKFPPDLIRNFASLVLDDIDNSSMDQAARNLQTIWEELRPVFDTFIDENVKKGDAHVHDQ